MEVLNDVSHNDFIKYAFIIIAGCMLEMYDFVVYSFFAVGIAQLFFPEQSFFNSLLLSYGTFAIGYFTRPLGATFFGATGLSQPVIVSAAKKTTQPTLLKIHLANIRILPVGKIAGLKVFRIDNLPFGKIHGKKRLKRLTTF